MIPVYAAMYAAQDVQVLKTQARLLLQRNAANPQIGALLAQVVSKAPNDPEARHLYAQWALINHQEQLCIDMASRAIALTPTDNYAARMQAFTLVAVAEDAMNRPAEAERAFLKSLLSNRKLPQPDARTAFEFVKFLEKDGKFEEAYKLVEELVLWGPGLGPLHLARARYFVRKKQLPQAIDAGEKALELAADTTQVNAAHAFLAKTYFAAGNPEAAERHTAALQK